MNATLGVVALSLAVQLVSLWLAWRRRADRFRLFAGIISVALAARSLAIFASLQPGPVDPADIFGELMILAASSMMMIAGLRAAAFRFNQGDPLQYSFLDRTPLPVLIKNPDGRYAFVNRGFEETFDMPLSRVIGRRVEQIWPVDIGVAAEKADRAALDGMSAVHQEFSYVDETGETSYWIASKFPLALGDQPPVIGAVFIDITDQKRVEKRLAEREKRYQLAIYGAGIWDWDVATDQLYVSPKFAELLGFGEADLPTLDREFIAGSIHPDDYEKHQLRLRRHFRDPSVPYESEHRYRTKSGAYRWFRVSGQAVLGPNGRPVRVAGLITDIDSERRALEALRESEARMVTLLDNSPAAIYFKDAEARFLIANRRHAEVYGVSIDEIRGKTAAQAFPGEAGRSYLAHDREVIAKRKLVVHEEQVGDQTYLTAKFPVILPDGRLLGVAGIETEITELIRIETEIRRAKEAAENANRAKSLFLANMSHELRTPLNSIIGFAEVVLSGVAGEMTNEKHREYLHHISHAGQMLLQLINDILDLSRIEAGKVEIEETTVDIPEIVAATVQLIAERAARNNVVIADNVPYDTPYICGDHRYIKQMLLNLLSNAVKFSPPNGIVRIAVNRRRDGSISISVSDNGPGIADEDIERVQQPFAQVADTMTRHHEGTGLGLPIVKSLIERHGGTLSLVSSLGVGTTATITFPKSRVLPGPAARKES